MAGVTRSSLVDAPEVVIHEVQRDRQLEGVSQLLCIRQHVDSEVTDPCSRDHAYGTQPLARDKTQPLGGNGS